MPVEIYYGSFGGGGTGGGSSFSAGVSTQGNTLGTTGTNAAGIVLVGGTNITLSQSSGAGGATISFLGQSGTLPPIATAVKAVAGAASVGTITRYSPEDHVHPGVGGLVASNTASTFIGNVVLSGTNLTLVTGGASNAGSLGFSVVPELHNIISASGNTTGTLSSQTTGTIVLAGGKGITLSQSSNTISIMDDTPTLWWTELPFQLQGPLQKAMTMTAGVMSHRPAFQGFYVPAALGCKTIRIPFQGVTNTGSLVVTFGVGFYSVANSTALSLATSTTNGVSMSGNFGPTPNWLEIPDLSGFTLTRGQWVAGFHCSVGGGTDTAKGNIIMLGPPAISSIPGQFVYSGTDSVVATNASNTYAPWMGMYSTVSGLLPAAVGTVDIIRGGSSNAWYMQIRNL